MLPHVPSTASSGDTTVPVQSWDSPTNSYIAGSWVASNRSCDHHTHMRRFPRCNLCSFLVRTAIAVLAIRHSAVGRCAPVIGVVVLTTHQHGVCVCIVGAAAVGNYAGNMPANAGATASRRAVFPAGGGRKPDHEDRAVRPSLTPHPVLPSSEGDCGAYSAPSRHSPRVLLALHTASASAPHRCSLPTHVGRVAFTCWMSDRCLAVCTRPLHDITFS